MKSEGYAPNNFPFQAFVHKLYMVITAKKKSKTGLQILPKKNNPYLSQKTEKNGGHCTCPLIKKISSSIYSFLEYHLRTLLEKIH